MARPKKIGLEYFPLNCQMDDKVEMLEAEHGLIGFALYIKLLQHIYQTNDAELDMSVVFRWKTLGKQLEMSVETLKAHIETMFAVGLFDRQAFDDRQVLTSNGIQKRRMKVAGLREKDRSRKAEADSADSPEFSDRKPTENAGKGKGKNTNVFKKESKLPPAPREGGDQKKIGLAKNASLDLEAQAPAPTSPPVAASPHSSPTSWPTADPARPFPGVVLPFDSSEFAALWGRWRVVAAERGAAYRGASSEQESLLALTRLSGNDNEALATAIIEQSLKHQTWKNFYPLKADVSQPHIIRTNRLSTADPSQRNQIGNPSFANDVA
jgi:hypothetical protein